MSTTTCAVCTEPTRANGLCRFHYQRQYQGVPLDAPYQQHLQKGTSVYDKVMALSIWDGECLVFTKARDTNGYGRIGIPGTDRSMLAHRAVMEHHFGVSKKYVLHSCDNPPCVRIEHLRYGSQLDNMTDAISRGRQRGTRTLSDEDVLAIRADPRKQRIIAAEYRIDPSYVSQIKSRKYRSNV